MDTKLNQSVILAIKDIFKKMLHCEVDKGSILLEELGMPRREVNVIINLVGTINGTLTFKSTRDIAKDITAKMLHVPSEEAEELFPDTISEFLNMVTGQVKNYYNRDENPFNISLPTAVIGEDYVIKTKGKKGESVSLIDFNYHPGGEFLIEIFKVEN